MPCIQATSGQQRPMNPPEPAASWSRRGWREDMRRLDLAVYAAVAATPTPTLDRFSGRFPADLPSAMPLPRVAGHAPLRTVSSPSV